jgi:hypothetical protein
MYDKDTLTYYKQLDNIIDKYNNTPHEGIDNLTPNQVHNHIQEIQVLNHIKYRDNIENLPCFEIGDIVRIEKLNNTDNKHSLVTRLRFTQMNVEKRYGKFQYCPRYT